VDHLADRVGVREDDLRDPGRRHPCAERSTICARRQVTTDPDVRRTIPNSRLPSSLLISRRTTLAAMIASAAADVGELLRRRDRQRSLMNTRQTLPALH